MGRSLLVALAALSLMCTLAITQAPPASAAVTVTAAASATTISEGSTVRISGKAWRARLGSVVVLQRWRDGAWRRVARKTLVDSRRFSFRVTPPRGVQRYRVRKPAHLGQAAATSPTVSVTVPWRPTVTAATSVFLRDDRMWVTRVTGTAPAYAGLELQHWDPSTGAWEAAGGATSADSEGHYLVDVAGRPAGWRFRLVSAPSGLRLPGYSPTLSAVQRPVPLGMNDEHHLGSLVADPATGLATLTLGAKAGDLVSVAIDQHARASTVSVALNGTPIATMEPYQQRVTTFRAPVDGTYRLTSYVYDGVSGPVTIWTSTVKTAPYDERCCTADQDRPGQILEFSLDAVADDMFVLTVPSGEPLPAPTRSWLDPAGGAVQPLYTTSNAYGDAHVFRLSTRGTHTLRYTAHELEALSVRDYLRPVTTVDTDVDREPVSGGATNTAGAGRFRFVAPVGGALTVTTSAPGELLTPAGERISVVAGDTCLADAPGGQYDLIVWQADVVFSARTANACPNH